MLLMALLEFYPMQSDVALSPKMASDFVQLVCQVVPGRNGLSQGGPHVWRQAGPEESESMAACEPVSIRELKIVLPRCFPSPEVT